MILNALFYCYYKEFKMDGEDTTSILFKIFYRFFLIFMAWCPMIWYLTDDISFLDTMFIFGFPVGVVLPIALSSILLIICIVYYLWNGNYKRICSNHNKYNRSYFFLLKDCALICSLFIFLTGIYMIYRGNLECH